MSDLSSLANTSVVNYVSFCLIFFVIKYKYFPDDKYKWVLAFFVIACLLQFVNNLYLSSLPAFCGGVQMNLSLYATLFPWIIIFGTFALFLIVFPGWLRIFSNTFGVKAAQMYGIDDTLDSIFTEDEKIKAADQAKSKTDININLLKAIDSIYNSKTIFVNELSPDNVNFIQEKDKDGKTILGEDGKPKTTLQWDQLDRLMPAGIVTNRISYELKFKLYNNVLLKDTVAYFMWYVLVGSLTVLISTNTLLSSGCSTESGDYNAIFNSS